MDADCRYRTPETHRLYLPAQQIGRLEIVSPDTQLVMFAHSGRLGRMTETRELVIGKSPYIAVYTVEDTIVTIHHVFHTSQQWPPEEE